MDFLSNLLSPSRLPIAVKNALLDRTTVSFKKQSSLGSVICNASKWGQEWDRKKKWQCDCHKIRHHLGANISTYKERPLPFAPGGLYIQDSVCFVFFDQEYYPPYRASFHHEHVPGCDQARSKCDFFLFEKVFTC
jgi:hypothetical protein